tara:strand:- start:1993 stop:2427 length:435 start_codon:yes stop_codon:yes gene_type:complete
VKYFTNEGIGKMDQWIPILVMLIVGIGFALLSLGVSYLLSPKNPTIEKRMPYECGISPEHEPSQRFPVKFYMVAMLYIVFDLEIVFLLLWATQFYQLGWYGILVVGIFTLFVLETLYYVWKRGVLDWNISGRTRYYSKLIKDAA